MPDANNSGETKIIYFNNSPVGKIHSTGDMRKDLEAAEAFLKEGGYLPEKIDDIDAMHNQANSFAKTAYDLYQRDLRSIPRVSASFVPFVVNAAFSIEIYLKTLHRRSGKVVKGHKLRRLFDALPETTKEIVLESSETKKILYNLEKSSGFLECLEPLNDAFEHWRYSYEYEYISRVGILSTIFLIDVLHESCCRTRPEAPNIEA